MVKLGLPFIGKFLRRDPAARIRSCIPSSTYRLQLHKDFTFADAQAQLAYFVHLGVSHLYLSPILTARAGSTHGYDVIDHDHVNPELGGEAGFRALAAACRGNGIGLIVDTVPNHMAIWHADNRAWLDVLENGAASEFADIFDIDFDSPEPNLAGKILAPILGKPYGDALNDGDITLMWDDALGKLAFAYGPHRLPLRPDDYALITGENPAASGDLTAWNTPERLDALLEQQNFRIAWWRTAGDAINWRRFFDINELAGLRIENPHTFEQAHKVIFRFYAEGLVDGLRIDHIDGLSDPAAYAVLLRQRLTALNARRPVTAPKDGPWIIVEKILGQGEGLLPGWQIDGTSGYDFMSQVSALQHDVRGEARLAKLWHDQSGRSTLFDPEETRARQLIVRESFAGQLIRTSQAFVRLAETDLSTRDLTGESFRRAIIAIIGRLRIYRSYATGREDGAPPGALFAEAMANAAQDKPAEAAAIAFIGECMAGRGPGAPEIKIDAARRFNQLSAPVAAKAVEDTAFYRYGRLISRNDVGFEARQFSLSTADFIASGRNRAATWPNAMLTTATHDHKQGEDVRARLAVISELPEMWRGWVARWSALNAPRRPERLDPADDYILYQVMAGAWPIGLAANDAAGLAAFAERLSGWRLKSLREAKLYTSWTTPDEEYERISLAWLATLLDPAQSGDFLDTMIACANRIAGPGAINGVVQAALRCTWPGVPDLYQGAECWDLSLVDPDNRRPVDFPLRADLLARGSQDWESGAIKLAVITELLHRRRRNPALFTRGQLRALPVRGKAAAHILAFERALGRHRVDIAAMLHIANEVTVLGRLPTAEWWGNTEVEIGGKWRMAASLFQRRPVHVEG